MYFDPKMTLEEYEDFKLHDEMNIGYDVEEDDLPDEIEEDSWICLLYTSPSPRDATLSRMPSSA